MLSRQWDASSVRLYAIVCVVVVVLNCAHAISNHPLLMVVLLDGFRWDYVDKFDTPHFDALIADGVRARHVYNVMPTVTMANHYTILTGKYVESHGIVANNFRDPNLGEFRMESAADQTDPKWFDTGVEPIWVTNQLNSHDRYSGSMLWPDALAAVKGIAPTLQRGPPLFDESIKNQTRIDTIISWFLHPQTPINLGLLYFEEPDETGHHFGPNSDQLNKTVVGLDIWIGYLVDQLKKSGLYEKMNILITADHGMSELLPNNFIDVSGFVQENLYKDYLLNSMGLLHPVGALDVEALYHYLKPMEKNYTQAKLKVYRKTDDFMKQQNYSNNDRISPIIVTVDEGWYLVRGRREIHQSTEGQHGFLPSVKNMHPFFIGHGPGFKKNYITESLRNIDFYELMCYLLEVTPAPNDGSLENIQHILLSARETDTTQATNYTLITYFCVAVFCALLTGVFTIGAIRHRKRRSRVISLEDVTLFQVNSLNHETKVPLLGGEEEEEDKEEETFDL